MALSSRSSWSAALAFLKSHDQPCGGEEPDGDVASACLPTYRDGQMSLAGSHVPVQDEILRVFDELERQQVAPAPVLREADRAPIVSIELLGLGKARMFEQSQTP
jgi:hypothetical protein